MDLLLTIAQPVLDRRFWGHHYTGAMDIWDDGFCGANVREALEHANVSGLSCRILAEENWHPRVEEDFLPLGQRIYAFAFSKSRDDKWVASRRFATVLSERWYLFRIAVN